MAEVEKYVIVGAGGAAHEFYHAIKTLNSQRTSVGGTPCECIGFLQDPEYEGKIEKISGYPPILGPIHGAVLSPDVRYLLGIGEPKNRRAVAAIFKDSWNFFPPFITPWSRMVSPESLVVKNGSYITCHFLSCDVQVGHFALVNGGIIGHDAVIGDYCEIGPGVVIGGHAHLEEGVHVASNCTIAPKVRIGAWSKISAGSAVMHDVPPYAFVIGVPGVVHRNFFKPKV